MFYCITHVGFLNIIENIKKNLDENIDQKETKIKNNYSNKCNFLL